MAHIDTDKLCDYLSENMAGFSGPLTLEKFPGGQSNPTFKVTATSGVYVLRKQPDGKLLKSAHAVDREYRVIKALADTKVPVAQVYHLCEDPTVIGSMFYVMEYCQGQVYWSASLADVSSNALRSKMYDDMNKTLAALHSVNLQQCGLTDYGQSGDYFDRQLGRWTKQYQATEIDPIEEMNSLMDWLADNKPENDGKLTLVHGDFRLDNLMFNDNGEVIAVLDWELSTTGHPFADLAYQCMQLRMPQGLGSIDGLAGVDREALGIPSEEDYIKNYCQRMGYERIEHWTFYLAFSFFRLAAIAQGVAKRASLGNASNSEANKVGAFVKPLAQMALKIIHTE